MKEDTPIIYLDIELLGGEEDQELRDAVIESLNGDSFREVLTSTLYVNLLTAIEKGKDRFIAFRIPYHNQDYVIKKNQYRDLLYTMLRYAEEDEDYTKCGEIKKLIENI